MIRPVALTLALAAVVCAQPKPPDAHYVTAQKPLRLAQLSSAEIRQILMEVEKTSFDTPDSWDEELRVGRTAEGASELLLIRGTQLLCGATGNCQVWIFVRSKDRWLPVLDQRATLASTVGVEDQITKGLHDLRLVTNLGGRKNRYTRYRFDGKLYRAAECFDVESPDGPSDQAKITKVECH